MLRGTNTVERIDAAIAVGMTMADRGVLCLAAPHDGELTAQLQPMELYLCPECRRSAFLIPCDGKAPTPGDIAARYAMADSEELRTIADDALCTPTVRAAARQILQERG